MMKEEGKICKAIEVQFILLSPQPLHMRSPFKFLCFDKEMLRGAGNMVSVEGVLDKLLLNNGDWRFNCKVSSRHHTPTPFVQACSVGVTKYLSFSNHTKLPNMASQCGNAVKTCAMRRRMAFSKTDTYVLLEPGDDEKFVSKEELEAKLKGWLENWPGKALPPDLARFETIDDAVSFLVNSVCELEIDGNVGSIQWYEVRLD